MTTQAQLTFGDCSITLEGPEEYVRDQLEYFLKSTQGKKGASKTSPKTSAPAGRTSSKKTTSSKKKKPRGPRKGSYIETALTGAGELHESGKKIFTEEDVQAFFEDQKDKPNVSALVHQLKYKKEWFETAGRGTIRLSKKGLKLLGLPVSSQAEKPRKKTRKKKKRKKSRKVKPPRSGSYLEQALVTAGDMQGNRKTIKVNDLEKKAFGGSKDGPNMGALVHQLKYKKGWLQSAGRGRVKLTSDGKQVLEKVLARRNGK